MLQTQANDHVLFMGFTSHMMSSMGTWIVMSTTQRMSDCVRMSVVHNVVKCERRGRMVGKYQRHENFDIRVTCTDGPSPN